MDRFASKSVVVTLAVVALVALCSVGQAQRPGGAAGPGGARRGGARPGGAGRGMTEGRGMAEGRGMMGGRTAASSFSTTPTVKTEAEKKILPVLDEMNKQQRGGMMNIPEEDGRLFRLLTETTGAKTVVEIGTSNGFSGLWFCLGLRATDGKLITHEIDAGRAALARQNFKRAGVEDVVTLVEGDAHKEVAKLKGPIDILFLDADKEGYVDYLEKLLPLVRPGGLILAHNITQGMADPRYIKAITTNPDLETVFLNDRGVSLTLKKR